MLLKEKYLSTWKWYLFHVELYLWKDCWIWKKLYGYKCL